jgi:hypothetical protein
MTNAPTLIEFKKAVRDAFGCLWREFGFREVEPPAEQLEVNPFMVWFVNSTTLVQVQGINWGFAAQVMLGPADAGNDPHATVPLWPIIKLRRPELYAKSPGSPGQLGDIGDYAHALREVASDALRGDFGVFPSARAVVEAEAIRQRSQEQSTMRDRDHRAAVTAAGAAFRAGNFSLTVQLLSPYIEVLTPAERAKLEYARAHMA